MDQGMGGLEIAPVGLSGFVLWALVKRGRDTAMTLRGEAELQQ